MMNAAEGIFDATMVTKRLTLDGDA